MPNQLIAKGDSNYPKLLKEIGKEAPKALYYKGVLDDNIFKNCLAVVGSRRMTTYGKDVIEKIVGEVAAAGLTIVSGFMYGCDAQAHKVALRFGGRTIAVMPCGIDKIHPSHQVELYHDILNKKGLAISEYDGGVLPTNWMYPRRNRIVAGLSRAVLIIEAALGSGSLITANWARKFGRKIFVVPGPITSENSKGIMQLLKEGAGAVSGAEDILKYYKVKSDSAWPFSKKVSQNYKPTIEQEVLNRLKLEAVGVDDLARTIQKKASELGVILSMMELRGQIKQEGGKYYVS